MPIFEGLDNRELERIAGSMKQRTFSAGRHRHDEGQGGVGFFVIEDGEAKVTIHGDERRRLGPGDYFGEVALLNDSAAHGDDHGRDRPALLRHDLVGLQAAGREPRLDRLEAAPGDGQELRRPALAPGYGWGQSPGA